MVRYAIHYNGVRLSKDKVTNAGNPGRDGFAFHNGKGHFITLQAPAPQLLEVGRYRWQCGMRVRAHPCRPNAFQYGLRRASIHRKQQVPGI